MAQPPSFVAQGKSRLGCHLKRLLYGLKQSPRAWFGRQVSTAFGLHQLYNDRSDFYRLTGARRILMAVYV